MKLLNDVFVDVQGTLLANKGSAALDKFFEIRFGYSSTVAVDVATTAAFTFYKISCPFSRVS